MILPGDPGKTNIKVTPKVIGLDVPKHVTCTVSRRWFNAMRTQLLPDFHGMSLYRYLVYLNNRIVVEVKHERRNWPWKPRYVYKAWKAYVITPDSCELITLFPANEKYVSTRKFVSWLQKEVDGYLSMQGE